MCVKLRHLHTKKRWLFLSMLEITAQALVFDGVQQRCVNELHYGKHRRCLFLLVWPMLVTGSQVMLASAASLILTTLLLICIF